MVKVLLCCSLKDVKRALSVNALHSFSALGNSLLALKEIVGFCAWERGNLFPLPTGAMAGMQGAFRNPILSIESPSGKGTI